MSQSCSLFLMRRVLQVADHLVDVVLQRGHFALRLHLNRPREVAFGHGRGHFRDGAHLGGEIRRELIDVIGEIFPGAGSAGHVGLAAQFSFHTDFAGHRGHLVGERRERVDHAVDRVGQFGDFAFGFDQQFAFQIAVGDGRHDFRDAAHLVGQVAGHEVHVVGQILPRAGDASSLRAWPPSFPSVPTSRATRVTSEAKERELVHHRVDGVLQLENFAFDIDRDLLGQVAVGHRRGHGGDVTHLAVRLPAMKFTLSVRSFHVPANTAHVGLAAEFSFGADFARHARHFRGERAKLIHHRVDGVFQLENFAFHIHRDLLGKSPFATAVVTAAILRTWAVRLPAMKFTESVRSFHVPATPFTSAWPPSFPSVPTSRATRVTSAAKERELIHHRVDGVLQFEDFAFDIDRDFLGEVAIGDSRGHRGNVTHLAVRLPAMKFTESVRSFQVPATPFTSAWPPSFPSVPTSRATRVTSDGEGARAGPPSY